MVSFIAVWQILSGSSWGQLVDYSLRLVFRAAQGSVLGPRLFIMYTADLADTVEQHGVNCHSFADDTQLYLRCRCDESMTAAKRLENCIMDVSQLVGRKPTQAERR